MASSGIAALGSGFTWGSTSVEELTNIAGPACSATEVDITNHDSTGSYKEFVPGLLDGGEISLEGNYTGATGQALLISDFKARTTGTSWTISNPSSGTVAAGTGYVKGFEIGAPVDGKLSVKFTIKVSTVT